MGKRQSRRQVVAAAALALGLATCGGSGKKTPAPASATTSGDAGVDEEAEVAQIEGIAGAVNDLSPAVHTCWARAAADDFRLEGRIVLELELMGDGGARVSLSEDTTGDEVLQDCLLALWSDYQWPLVFAAGDRIVLPPFEFVAPSAQYTVASADVPVHRLLDEKLEVRVVADAQSTGNSQASLSLLRATAGLSVPAHSHSSAELLFVLSGTGRMQAAGGATDLGPGSAVFIPSGMPHSFTHTGEAPTELVQFFAPGGPEGLYKDLSNNAGTTEFTGTFAKRGARPTVRRAADLKPLSIMGGKGELLVIFEEAATKDPAAYMGALTAQPGAEVPSHRHADSSEYLFVLEGETEMRVAEQTLRVQSGGVVQIPPGVEHSARVTGSVPLKALQFYSPAGPEQRFKGGAQ